MAGREPGIQRQNGVALWRQIADRIRVSISNGDYDATGMVPPETTLASEFNVNRHTVRSALAALTQEGIVRAIQGRGTFIERKERFSFPISRRTRFNEGIGDQAREKEGILLDCIRETTPPGVARKLGTAAATESIRLETLRKVDGRAVARSTAWFPAPRFDGIEDAYRKTGSITKAFHLLGVPDYVRISTEIVATHASDDDMADLGLSPGAIVLVTSSLNADIDGVPVQYGVSRFPADFVRFTIDNRPDPVSVGQSLTGA